MAIRGGYAPPGVYTESVFESPTPQSVSSATLPLFIGKGRETIQANGLDLVRGSSATIDQTIVEEDSTGRAVLGTNPNGSPILGDFDGSSNKVRARNWPLVSGDGTGTTTTSTASVSATLNGTPLVILAVDGTAGIITLSSAPKLGDDLRINYFFNRTDTLVTDESLTDQVSTSASELLGSASDFVFSASTSTFAVTVDGVSYAISIPTINTTRSDNITRTVAAINAASAGSLVADTYVDQNSSTNLRLTAQGAILIGSGSANTALGVSANQRGSDRKSIFYTDYSPIVDGSNGGLTTTDVTRITVKVDGVEVVPSAVDGATGAITLSTPPKVGAVVTVSYYFNSFRDQYDFIPSRDVTEVSRVSLVPVGGSAASLFIEGVSWVLQDDKIVWGSAALPSAGSVQAGDISFGANQVSVALQDNRGYLLECAPVVDSSVIPARVLPATVKLPHQPVDGTGSGLPTYRSDLVIARVGSTIADALTRPAVAVTRVNPSDSTITLAQNIPTGQKVFATFYYSTLQDQIASAGGGYTITAESTGPSGIGTYSATRGSTSLFGATLESKGSDLTLVSLAFPSGSELIPDAHMASGTPVQETVTVQIENSDAAAANFITEGFGPFLTTKDGYSHDSAALGMTIDGTALVSLDLGQPLGGNTPRATLTNFVGEPLPYLDSSNNDDLGTVTGSILLEVDGVALSASLNSQANADASHIVTALNTASKGLSASYTATGAFTGSIHIEANSYDQLDYSYTGNVNGATAGSITLDQGDYTVAELATHIDGKIAVATGANFTFNCAADANGRLVFTLTALQAGDDYGYIEFINGAAGRSFESIAGIDTDSAAGRGQTKFGILPIASRVSVDLSSGGGAPLRDRLILRNRTVVGDNYFPANELGLSVVGGDILDKAGLPSTLDIPASRGGSMAPANIFLSVGWATQEANTSLPSVTLYDGSGAEDANDTLIFEYNSTTFTVDFNGSAGGTEYNMVQLAQAIALELGGNSLSVVLAGHGIRLVALDRATSTYIRILGGSANSVFGVSEGQTSASTSVPASSIVSSMMSHFDSAQVGYLNAYLFSEDVVGTAQAHAVAQGVTRFPAKAIARVSTSTTGREHIEIESLSAGVASSILFTGGTAVTTKGNGLLLSVGDGAVGEAAYQGFFVTSNHPAGSGSANTSKINDGVGQDGVIGQTYEDSVTGFTFTLLERDGGATYPTGGNATLQFKVSRTLTANANIPNNLIAGVALTVANTTGVAVGDTALVETFNKSGSEPSIGQVYYLDIVRQKQAFGTAIFNSLGDVIAEFGDLSSENSLTMAAFFAFSNGVNEIALHQVPVLAGEADLTTAQVLEAIQAVEGEVISGVSPSVIVPLVPASDAVLTELSLHCDIQSSLRYRAERTGIMGFAAGTLPEEAARMASATSNSRVRVVYPDIVSATVTNTQGVTANYLLDGRYLAVAVAAATQAGTVDAATPWTNRAIRGFDSLSRSLDAVDANRTAERGVTILQQRGADIVIRHGLTTDISSVLNKTPTVVQIADEVHRRARNLLGGYIGVKYLPSILPQIEGRVNAMFKALVAEQIIDSYTGIAVRRDPEDPTGMLVECFYKPVFPLLYIQFTFNIRSSD